MTRTQVLSATALHCLALQLPASEDPMAEYISTAVLYTVGPCSSRPQLSRDHTGTCSEWILEISRHDRSLHHSEGREDK